MRRHAIHRGATVGERAADRAASLIGSWRFLIGQSLVLAAWIVGNSIALTRHFDPFPYILCNLALSFQAAFTGPVLLIAANRAAQRDRRRDDIEAAEVDELAATTKEIHRINLAQTQMLDMLHEILQQQRGGR